LNFNQQFPAADCHPFWVDESGGEGSGGVVPVCAALRHGKGLNPRLLSGNLLGLGSSSLIWILALLNSGVFSFIRRVAASLQ